MNERDYIIATNCARLQMAVDAMTKVLGGSDYGLDAKMLNLVKAKLSLLIDQAFTAADERADD